MPLPLCLANKRAGRSLAATGVAGRPYLGRLFYIHDSSSNMQFLVDTGAEVSVVPPSRTERMHGQGAFTVLQAVNGSQIATGQRRTFRWVFAVAEVKQPILGADFLHHFGLRVDVRTRTLSDPTTSLQIHGLTSNQTATTSGSFQSSLV